DVKGEGERGAGQVVPEGQGRGVAVRALLGEVDARERGAALRAAPEEADALDAVAELGVPSGEDGDHGAVGGNLTERVDVRDVVQDPDLCIRQDGPRLVFPRVEQVGRADDQGTLRDRVREREHGGRFTRADLAEQNARLTAAALAATAWL